MPRRRFLLVGNTLERVQLLAHALRTRYPDCVIPHASELEAAGQFLRTQTYDVVILVVSEGKGAAEVVTRLRQINAAVPVIVVSTVDQSEPVLAAGATGFLKGDEALRIGQVVANVLAHRGGPVPTPEREPRTSTDLRTQVESLAKSIAFHEEARRNLLLRRRGAADHVMVEIDDRLKVNERTLKTLRRTHQLILFELAALSGGEEVPPPDAR
jgi:DNA-binding NarL/FixJ family response regulator